MRVLVLGGCAAAMAAAIALAPMVIGARTQPTTTSLLNRVEGTAFNHNGAHLPPTKAAKRRALILQRRCEKPGWRATHAGACPAKAPTPSQALSARMAGEEVTPLGPTEPDGLWGPLLSIPSTAIHAIVLPTNKVLFLSQPKGIPGEIEEVNGGNAYVWDPATNTSRSVPPPDVPYPNGSPRPANLWCGGQISLADGRVLVVGGNLAYTKNGGKGNGVGAGNGFKGGKWVMTFDPWTEKWTRYADMPHGRWYPTLTELPDGRVLILGGWDETGGVEGPAGPDDLPLMVSDQDVEVFDPATPAGGQATTVVSHLPPDVAGQTAPYPDHQGIGLYPHVFVLPDTTVAGAGGDKLLVAGPGKYDSAIIDTSTWMWTDVLDRSVQDTGQPRLSSDRSWGTAWLAPSGPDGSTKVVLLGGSDAGTVVPGFPGDAPAPLKTAEALDLNDPDGGWQPDPAFTLNDGRAHFNTVLLPDESIFTNGGGYGRKNGSLYEGPVYRSELYTPGGTWREVGNEDDARTYHSTSVLLPDGRVASAGDDRDIAPEHITVANRTAQLWSPPYLFDGPRPVVTFAPGAVGYDQPFRVTVAGAPATMTRAELIRPAAVTHSVDMAQRAISLDVTADADGLTLQAPLNATVAPPGYYMLFLLNADGVPSVASWVKIDPSIVAAPAPPATPVVTPAPEAPVTAVPVPAPPGTRVLARLSVTVQKPTVRVVGSRVRVNLRLRSNRRTTVRITLIRPPHGNTKASTAIGTRTITLRANTVLRPAFLVQRALLGSLRSFRISVVARDATGERLIINRVAEFPRR